MLWNTRPRSCGTAAHDHWNAHKVKSVVLTDEGLQLSEALFAAMFSKGSED